MQGLLHPLCKWETQPRLKNTHPCAFSYDFQAFVHGFPSLALTGDCSGQTIVFTSPGRESGLREVMEPLKVTEWES